MSAHNENTHGHATDPKTEAKVYIGTLVGLLILTAITVAAAGIHFESGSTTIVIALTIATIKATLVALFFMHLLHEKPVNAVIAVAGFLFLGILLLFCFLDVGSRSDLQPHNLHVMPAASAVPAGSGPTGTAPSSTPAAAGLPAQSPAPAPAADTRKE